MRKRRRQERREIKDRQKEEIEMWVALNVYSGKIFITEVYTRKGRFFRLEWVNVKQSAECACL